MGLTPQIDNILTTHTMRKLFLLISILTLSIVANAATININTETADALRLALNSANNGDEIVMAAGTYVESNSNYIAFAAKHVTVKAAENANVIIQPKVPVTIAEGGCAHFENVKFDVSKLTELADWYEHLIYPTDVNASNSMILEGCEFYGFSLNKSLLFCGSSNRLASVTINNCYFHNIMKSCLFIESTEAINISISNSTFANITTDAGSYWAGVIDTRATSGSFSVDHCTFYNVKAMNTDYAAIGKVAIPGAVVSNCIFAMPESTDNLRAIHMEGGNANNCLIYNYTYDSGWAIRSNVTKNDKCIKGTNPLFKDAANGDFTLNNASPARGKGTSSTDLGDPRWAKAISPITIPATLLPVDATMSDSAGVVLGTPDVIDFKVIGSHNYNDKEWAKWKIKVTTAGYYTFTANVRSTNVQTYTLTVLNSDESSTLLTKDASGLCEDCTTSFTTDAVELSAGEYNVKIVNTKSWSTGDIISIVANYAGGAATEIPGLLKAEDAVLEAKKMYHDENGYIHYGSYGTIPTDEYAYWRITTTDAYSGKVILDIPAESNGSGHEFHVELYTDLNGSKLSEAYETAVYYADNRLIELEQTFEISEAGTYYVKLVNATQWSSAVLRSISIAPNLASTIDEEETDVEAVIGANDGKTVNVQLTRSLVAGMYNTICLPFAVSAAEMGRVFQGAVVKELSSSSIEEGEFVLNLNFTAVNEMAAGKPYLIKPAADIVNPKFIGVTIDKTLRPINTSNANFVGNFVKGTIPADENNLFLGANNTLYFPTVDTEIKGMRAYFIIHDAPAGAIKRARIVEGSQVATDIELVESQEPQAKSQKMIVNGQLYIMYEGQMYNVQGLRIK